jgi:hypothetical protein
MIESCYTSRDSNAFIYYFLQKFGLSQDNSNINYVYRDGSLHIDLMMTQDSMLYIFDTPMRAKKDEVFTILDSKRQTDGYLTKQFDAA